MKNQLECHLTNDEQFMFKELEELLYSHRLTYLLLGRGTIFLKQVFSVLISPLSTELLSRENGQK